METCTTCGKFFRLEFAYQVGVVGSERKTFCHLDCRRAGLGEATFSTAKRARVIAVLNQKGGTGKTTTSVNLAAGVAEKGFDVLLIDMDAQGNVGASLGVKGEHTLCHVLVEGKNPLDVAVPVRGHLDVITADESLAKAEVWLARQDDAVAAHVLSSRMTAAMVQRSYQYIVIDCGPSLNLLNRNALTYADEVIIPVTCDYLALVGVRQVMKTIRDIEKHLSHSVRIAGVVPTFFDPRTRLARESIATLQGHFKERCLEPIRINTRLAEAPTHRKTIFEHAPDSHGAEDYHRLVDRIVTEVAAMQAIDALTAAP